MTTTTLPIQSLWNEQLILKSIFFPFRTFIGVADTNNVIGFAIGAMFVREVFHGEAKPQGNNFDLLMRTNVD